MNFSRTWTSWRRLGAALATGLGLVAASFPASQAMAADVTVGSSTCTYGTFAGDSLGNFTFTGGTCGSGTSTGTLKFASSSASLATSGTYDLAVTRTGGSSGAASATVTTNGTCTLSSGTVNFADGITTSAIVTVTAPAAVPNPNTCVVTLGGVVGATPGSPSTFTATIVDPNSDVTFKFATTTSNASFGGSGVNIAVTRSGGTNGEWSVPFTLSGNMFVDGGGTVVPADGILNFPPGTQTKNITYTAPPAVPAGVTLPAAMTFTLGTPIGIAPAPGPQLATVVAPTAHSVNVVQETVCSTTATKEFVYPNTQYKVMGVKPGETAAIALTVGPTTMGTDLVGKWTMLESTGTTQNADVQFTVSACPGDFQPASANCVRHTSYTGGYINFGIGPIPASWASWLKTSACMLPAGTTKVYLNFRQVKKPAAGTTLVEPGVPSCSLGAGCPPIVVFN